MSSSLRLGLLLAFALPALVSGMTANPRPFVTTHGPKGDENEQTATATTITLRLNGDPTHQCLTDVDGFTCLMNEETEYYHYAVRASSRDNANTDPNGHPNELVPHPTAIGATASAMAGTNPTTRRTNSLCSDTRHLTDPPWVHPKEYVHR